MKQLIQNIQNRLADATFPEQLKPKRKNDRLFEYVDIDWGQVDFYSDFPPPVKYPSALIDISSASYSNEGNHIQMGVVDIQVRIIELVLSNSSYRAPEGQKERALRVFDLAAEVNRILHGWCGSDHYGPLTRQSFSKVNRRDGLREYRLIYRVQLTDKTAAKKQQVTTALPLIAAKFVSNK